MRLNPHENCEQTKVKLIRYYFLEREYNARFFCQKCLAQKCAIPACSISRKGKGISIFKVPLANNKFNTKWNQDLVTIILKYQHRDKSLNERIESPRLFICEKHFRGWGVHKRWSFYGVPAKKWEMWTAASKILLCGAGIIKAAKLLLILVLNFEPVK